jgi:hypothetical protein
MQWDTKQPYDVGADFTATIASGPFVDVERVTFAHAQILTREGLLRRVSSTSYISTMEDEQRDLLMGDVITVVDALTDPIVLPYITTAYSARAVMAHT